MSLFFTHSRTDPPRRGGQGASGGGEMENAEFAAGAVLRRRNPIPVRNTLRRRGGRGRVHQFYTTEGVRLVYGEGAYQYRT